MIPHLFNHSFPSFWEGTCNWRATSKTGSYKSNTSRRPDEKVRGYLHGLKKIMQRLTTSIVEVDVNDKGAVMEKQFNVIARKKTKQGSNQKEEKVPVSNKQPGSKSKSNDEKKRKEKKISSVKQKMMKRRCVRINIYIQRKTIYIFQFHFVATITCM